MTVDELRQKVKAAEEKVEKCKKTIERHKTQMEKKATKLRAMGIDPETADMFDYARHGSHPNEEAYWLLSDYDDKKRDIAGATEKLEDAERICANWIARLDLRINQEMVIQNQAPEIIKKFLEDWKEKTFQWYIKRHARYLEVRDDLRKQEREARIEAVRTLPEYADTKKRWEEHYGDLDQMDEYHLINLWPRKPVEEFLKEKGLTSKAIKEKLSWVGDRTVVEMCNYRNEDERLAWLDKQLEKEKMAHLLWFVETVTEITGPITDAAGLCMSGGDLNGIVFGEKGAANVTTFSAGGWNIQRFHFRTRVDDVTEKVFKNTRNKKQDLDTLIQSAQDKQEPGTPGNGHEQSVTR